MNHSRFHHQRGSVLVETALTSGLLILTALAALQLAVLAEKKLRCEAAAAFAVRAHGRGTGQAQDDILAICRHTYFAPSDEIRITYTTSDTATTATVTCTPRLFTAGFPNTPAPDEPAPRVLTVSATAHDPTMGH